MQGKRRKSRQGVEMVARSLYLPKDLMERVDRYAEVRDISRNVAFEELLAVAADGPEALPISRAMLQLAFEEAGFKRFA